VNGGALDAAGSQKLARLLKLCDVMNLPVVQFVDVRTFLSPPCNCKEKMLSANV
jgi:acetyl-CoA carboxylase carboxyltransferase component